MAKTVRRNLITGLSIADMHVVPVTIPHSTNIPGGVATTFRIVCPDESVLTVKVVLRDIRFVPIVERLLGGAHSRAPKQPAWCIQVRVGSHMSPREFSVCLSGPHGSP